MKVIKITVDEDALVSEEDENNNEATRINISLVMHRI
jgi:subtilase family serine protease